MTIAELMAQPTTMYEPADPIPLRAAYIDADEMAYLAIHHNKPIELHDTTAVLVVGLVRYVAGIAEACS